MERVRGRRTRRAAAQLSAQADRRGAELLLDQLGDLGPVFDAYPDAEPSYVRGLGEIRLESSVISALGSRHPYWKVNPKREGARFAAALGVAVPENLASALSLDAIDFDTLPEAFVLKPANGSTNRGVFALRRRTDGRFDELLTREPWSEADVRREYTRLRDSGQVSSNVLVEELLEKPDVPEAVPDDIKVFCFYDQAALILQRDMGGTTDPGGWRFKLWTPDFDDVGPINWAAQYDPSLAAPVAGPDIVEQALMLSRALRLPALRVDFLETSRGPVFGEFTMTPGLPGPFTPAADRALGAHLIRARAQLAIESFAG